MRNKKTTRKIFLAASIAFVILLGGLIFPAILLAQSPYDSVPPSEGSTDIPPAASDWNIEYKGSTATGTATPPASSGTPISGETYPGEWKNPNTQPIGMPGAKPVQAPIGMPGAKPVTVSDPMIPSGSEIGLPERSIRDILMGLLNWLLAIVGVVALIGFVISGLQYILAAGNDGLMETGKKNMTYSIIGVVIVLGSLVIVRAIDYALRGYSGF